MYQDEQQSLPIIAIAAAVFFVVVASILGWFFLRSFLRPQPHENEVPANQFPDEIILNNHVPKTKK